MSYSSDTVVSRSVNKTDRTSAKGRLRSKRNVKFSVIKSHLEHVSINERIILKWISENKI